MIGTKHGLTLVCAILFSTICGCALWEDETLPDELIGVWETDAPRYRNCPTEISKRHVIFQTVTGESDINTITKVEKTTEKGKTLYHIHYKNSEGLVYRLSFFFYKTPEGDVIQYKNQSQLIWKKKKSSETSFRGNPPASVQKRFSS